MVRKRFQDEACPSARTIDVVGDAWTPVLMREAFMGRRRFDDFQKALSLSRGVLAQRLARLVDEGMLEKRLYQERPERYEYVLTDKGRDFYPVLAAMWRWGSDWLWEDGDQTPLELRHRDSGETIQPRVVDEHSGEAIDVRKIRVGARRDAD